MPSQLVKSAQETPRLPLCYQNSNSEYDAATQEGTVVVTFFATWNGPSRQIKPFVEEQSNKKEYANFKFVQVDADECPELTEREDVSSMPTLKIYKNGKCIQNLAGANVNTVSECLKKLIQAN